MIAALYIDPRGPYPEIARRGYVHACAPLRSLHATAIDCWDATRDARLYAGPHPVVAHPPCRHWGRLRHLAKDAECPQCRYRTALGRAGNATCAICNGTGRVSDRDCAPRAVEQVRAFGGVLEHPAGSKLWEEDLCPAGSWSCRCNRLPKAVALCTDGPTPIEVDAYGGYTIELDQCEWGHVARKRTWLYLVGVPRDALEAPPFPGREPTHWISGGRGRQGKKAKTTPVPPGIKVASAQQRRRTPPLFAEYLVRLARAVRRA